MRFQMWIQIVASILFLNYITASEIYESARCSNTRDGSNFHQFNHTTIDGRRVNFQSYRGQVVLVVNVATF